jgi:hydrogenase nickel incorporation protein HypA/HybF
MHELSIAQNILDIIEETFSENNYKELLEVRVRIGELVAVVPESLSFCYESLIKDTKYEKSKLTIEIIRVQASCKNCRREFNPKEFLFICPFCQSKEIEVLQGNELNISHLDVN